MNTYHNFSTISEALHFDLSYLNKKRTEHSFHLVNSSPWPLCTSIAVFMWLFGTVMYLHSWINGGFLLALGFLFFIFCITCWWRDVIVESTYEGQHTEDVQNGIKFGMVLFIISEVMFFFGFFWGFFYLSVSPAIWIGSVWPPVGLDTPSPWHIPFLNTVILIFSGISLTWAHYALLVTQRLESLNGVLVTIFAGVFFIAFQAYEYLYADFFISTGAYGSTFFLTTGFHGFHVFVGLTFIVVCFVRQVKYHFTDEHHVGFESASWYWHFVDVVWIGLFLSIYWWGGGI